MNFTVKNLARFKAQESSQILCKIQGAINFSQKNMKAVVSHYDIVVYVYNLMRVNYVHWVEHRMFRNEETSIHCYKKPDISKPMNSFISIDMNAAIQENTKYLELHKKCQYIYHSVKCWKVRHKNISYSMDSRIT